MEPNKFLRFSRSFLISMLTIVLLQSLAPGGLCQNTLKIYGQVIGDNGPVENAVVSLENTTFQAITDGAGYFYIYDIPPGKYRLICRRNGIQVSTADDVVVGDGPAVRRDIYFDEGIINIAPVYVVAGRPRAISESGFEVKVFEVGDLTNKNVEDLLQSIPGLNLIVSSAASEIYISSGGVRPEGVNVLVDGHKINSLLTGRADLSQIPLKSITRIEYYSPGLTSTASDGGLAGTINFVTATDKSSELLQISSLKGSFDREDYAATLDYFRQSLGDFKATWETGFVRNDYKYTDLFGRAGKRLNAFSKYRKHYFSYSNMIERIYLRFSGFAYSGQSGVPGRTISPSQEARSLKQTISIGAEATWAVQNAMRLGMVLSHLKRDTDYEDTSLFIPYDNSYSERETFISLKADLTAGNNFSFNYGFSYTNSNLEGIDHIRPALSLGKIRRDVYKYYGGTRYRLHIGKMTWSVGISQALDLIDHSRQLSTSATSTLAYNRGPANVFIESIGVTFSYARSFRLPGLAELHWREDVFVVANPDLRPERSRFVSSEIFGEYKLAGRWRLSVEYRDMRYKDLIYWRRSQGIQYKPVNVSASHFFSATASISYVSPSKLIELDFSRVKSVALNREKGQPYYGKYITFQPPYTNHLAIRLNHREVYAGVTMFDSGLRYFLEENTKKLNPYTLVNLKVGFNMAIKKVTAIWELKVDNLTDAEYEHLEYQPMPRRSYSFGLTIKI